MNVGVAHEFFTALKPVGALDQVSSLILDEIRRRTGYLVGVGLEYLTLDRQSRTLSGGELERVDLTTAIGSSSGQYSLRPRRTVHRSPSA